MLKNMIDYSYCPDRYVRVHQSQQRRLFTEYLNSIPSMSPARDESRGKLKEALTAKDHHLYAVSTEYNSGLAHPFTCMNAKVYYDYYRLYINGVQRQVVRAVMIDEKAATAQMLEEFEDFEKLRADRQQAPTPPSVAGDSQYYVNTGPGPSMPPPDEGYDVIRINRGPQPANPSVGPH